MDTLIIKAPAPDSPAEYTDEERMKELQENPLSVLAPFPFETLAEDLRRKVLGYVLTAPTDGAASALRVHGVKRSGFERALKGHAHFPHNLDRIDRPSLPPL